MRGLWHLDHVSKAENAKARSLFMQAVELDPSYAKAWDHLAGSHFNDAFFRWTDSPNRSLVKMDQAIRGCIEADRQFAGCYRALSLLHERRGEPDRQIAALERAISLDPSDALSQGGIGVALTQHGRSEEAVKHFETAMRLDPMSPSRPLWFICIAWTHFDAGRYEAALQWANRSLDLKPDYEFGYRTLAATYAQLGQMEKARAAVAEQLRLEPEMTVSRIREQSMGVRPDFRERWLNALRRAGLPE
jgi:tetratricopeptide (TPR) repeat protein